MGGVWVRRRARSIGTAALSRSRMCVLHAYADVAEEDMGLSLVEEGGSVWERQGQLAACLALAAGEEPVDCGA